MAWRTTRSSVLAVLHVRWLLGIKLYLSSKWLDWYESWGQWRYQLWRYKDGRHRQAMGPDELTQRESGAGEGEGKRRKRAPSSAPSIPEGVQLARQHYKWRKFIFWNSLIVYSPINIYLGLTKFWMLRIQNWNKCTFSPFMVPSVPIFRCKGTHNSSFIYYNDLFLIQGADPNLYSKGIKDKKNFFNKSPTSYLAQVKINKDVISRRLWSNSRTKTLKSDVLGFEYCFYPFLCRWITLSL